MQKVLVTGATGFIGRYVVQELSRRDTVVVATASGRSDQPPGAAEFRPFKFEEFDSTINYFEYFGQPDRVIHLAWEGLPNYKQPFHFEINLPRHFAFLKNLVSHGLADLTVTGTCFEYGMRDGALSEDMITDPQNAYALAKDCLHKFLNELQKSTPFQLKWARLFYLFGSGQAKTSLLAQLETALEAAERVFRMSPGLQIRDYLPVGKVAKYICDIALQDTVTGTINCCSGKPISVKELVENYLADKGKSIELDLGFYPYPDYEAMAFWGDTTKLQTAIHE